MTSTTRDSQLIEAVHDRTLVAWATSRAANDANDAVAQSVLTTCSTIGSQVRDELARLDTLIASAGLTADLVAGGDGSEQIHAIDARVDSYDTARRVADVAETVGYRRWGPAWEGGAEQSFRRTSRVLTLALSGDVTRVLSLRWPSTSKLNRLPSVIRPNAADWEFVSLPGFLWPLYFLIRPVRLVLEKVGLRSSTGAGQLGPFLSTPRSLIDGLFDFAQIGPRDHVVDIGCGDGRLVVEAARRRGCLATGVETDAGLVSEANRRVAEAGLDARVTIIEGDGEAAIASGAVANATVILLFLPADVAGRLVPGLVAAFGPEVRIVAHEQHRIETPITPTKREVLLGTDSITVAQLWSGQRRP